MPADGDAQPAFLVIGVGASAGGLEALEQFFDGIPDTLRAAFVVVQHLAADHKSLMAGPLGKHTRLPVLEAVDGQALEPGTVTLVPAHANLEVEQGRLRFRERGGASPNLPINLLFTSLAAAFAERAVGVVLSGTGSDGRNGIEAIKEAGGLVFAQEPTTARFGGMPLAAIGTGLVDQVLAPQEMGPQLAEAHAGSASRPTPDDADAVALRSIHARLQRSTGIDFSEYKPVTVLRRMARRMAQLKVGSLAEYARRLEEEPTETQELSRELLINVTQFFRDPEVFDAFKEKLLGPLVTRAGREPLRVWVPGCSTGQEAYSLAMLLAEARPVGGFKVFATDVDAQALEVAAAGVYTEDDVADVPEALRARYLRRVGAGWQIDRELRRFIVFAPQNVAKDPPFTRLDLISCRNLLIYLSPELQKRVLATFAFALKPEGALVLGSSETLGELGTRFTTVDGRLKLFRRAAGPSALPDAAAYVAPRAGGPLPSELQQAVDAATRLMLDRVVPAAVLTNEKLEVQRVFGNSERLLLLPVGAATLHLPAMLPPSLQTLTDLAAHRALALNTDTVMATPDGEATGVGAVRVQPFTTGGAGSRFLVITFERALGQGSNVDGPATSVSDEAARQISDLQREVLFVRESLQATIEQLETVNEELQASNEELLASNEELQSTNEEQQSANEELRSVDAERALKMVELAQVNADLDNLFVATNVGTLFLDEKLRVRRFSKSLAQQFSLLERDVGRPIEDITHRFTDLRFPEDLRQVQDTAQILEREVTTAGGQHFLLKLSPFLTPERQVRGVVATFVEETGLRGAQEARARLQYVVDALPEQVAMVGRDGVIRLVNRAWSEFARANGGVGLEARGGVGADYLEACRSVPDVRAAIEAVMLGSRERFSHEYPCHSPTQQRWFVMHAGRMGDGSGVVISHVEASAQRSTGAPP